jgi:two-component system CheB/CheR fusion protein
MKPNINVPNLEGLIRDVIDSLAIEELEVTDHHHRHYLLRIRPYRTKDHKIDGAVITLLDITALKDGMHKLALESQFSDSIVETVRQPILVLDDELRVRRANAAFYRSFHVEKKQTLGERIYHLGHGQWDIPKLRALLEDVLLRQTRFHDFEIEHVFPKIGFRKIRLNARRLEKQNERLILLAFEDVTEEAKFAQQRDI